jgi:hypothetical protein
VGKKREEASLLSTSEAGKERGNKVSIRRFLWPEETRKGETVSFQFPAPSPGMGESGVYARLYKRDNCK